jgi:hypothetical protein
LYLAELRRLELPNVPLDDATARLFADPAHLPALRELVVQRGPDLSSFGVAALRERFGKQVTIHARR